MRRLLLIVASILGVTLILGSVVVAQAGPEFRLSFKALADQIPEVVGQPLEDEHWTADGNLIQRTSSGLMVWRMSDRWTVFTNGVVTWILGPYGLQSRPNGELYPWESVPPGPSPLPQPETQTPPPPPVPPTAVPAPPAPAPPASPAPPAPIPAPAAPAPAPPAPTPVPSRTYTPDAKGMDEVAGGTGLIVKNFMQSIADKWAALWGWRPHRPVTYYFYSDGLGMAYGYTQIVGAMLSPDELDRIASTSAVLRGNDLRTGGWAILMNLNYRLGSEDWEFTTKALALAEYARVMQADVAGNAGPEWFKQGMAQWMAYFEVTGTPAEKTAVSYAGQAVRNGTLPTLSALSNSWNDYVGSGPENAEAAYGASYLAVKYLASKVGGMPVLITLQRVGGGQDFDSALQAATGYSVGRLESEYRNTIPLP